MTPSVARTPWYRLSGGLIAIAALAAIMFSVLAFAQPGGLHGSTIRLYVATNTAGGLMKGSEVWLDGRKVGLVKAVDYLPTRADTVDRLIITADILKTFAPKIRRDATSQVRAGYSLIGSRVLAFVGGTPNAPAVQDGDTVRALTATDFEGTAGGFGMAAKEFPEIISNVKLIAGSLRADSSAFGEFANGGSQQISVVGSRAAKLGAHISGGSGFGTLTNSDVFARARHAVAQSDSILQLVNSDKHSLGRFQRDSTLLTSVEDVRNEMSIVQSLLKSPDGTIGRMSADSAYAVELARAQRQIGALMTDLKRHPMRYFAF